MQYENAKIVTSSKKLVKNYIMANTIAKYEFSSSQVAETASDQLRSKVSSNSGVFYRSGCYIEITDECPDVRLATQICIANGGEPVHY